MYKFAVSISNCYTAQFFEGRGRFGGISCLSCQWCKKRCPNWAWNCKI